MIKNFLDKKPRIAPNVFIAESADVIGHVTIEEGASIWFHAVLRGDTNKITVGKKSNVQDLCVIHASPTCPVVIGEDVTIGHRAVIHGCTIGNRCLIGMGSVIMDGAKIGDDSVIAAGSLLTNNTEVLSNSVFMGAPAKFVRNLKPGEYEWLKKSAQNYCELAGKYLENRD